MLLVIGVIVRNRQLRPRKSLNGTDRAELSDCMVLERELRMDLYPRTRRTNRFVFALFGASTARVLLTSCNRAQAGEISRLKTGFKPVFSLRNIILTLYDVQFLLNLIIFRSSNDFIHFLKFIE